VVGYAIAAGLGGLILGSFANVLVHRVPKKESIVRPGSRCPSCGTPLAARDNIPVLSWVLLRGRCRHCRAPISVRYPLVELLTGLLFALTVLRIPNEQDWIAYLPLAWVLVVLAFIDLEHKILPNRIVIPSIGSMAALLGVAAWLGPSELSDWGRALAAGAVSFLAFFVLALISPRGMGMGDVKLAAVLGMALGYFSWPDVFVGFFLAFAAGAVGGIALIVAKRGGLRSEVPFGPWLALGTMIGVLWGGPLVKLWLPD